jgi:hypothetical protein
LYSFSSSASEEQEQEEAGLPENSQQTLDILSADLVKAADGKEVLEKNTPTS